MNASRRELAKRRYSASSFDCQSTSARQRGPARRARRRPPARAARVGRRGECDEHDAPEHGERGDAHGQRGAKKQRAHLPLEIDVECVRPPHNSAARRGLRACEKNSAAAAGRCPETPAGACFPVPPTPSGGRASMASSAAVICVRTDSRSRASTLPSSSSRHAPPIRSRCGSAK